MSLRFKEESKEVPSRPYIVLEASLLHAARHWGCSRRMRRGAIEWTFIGWNEMRA
jgi:hypothetical protein